ncbi:MAG: hypothetical protein IM674_03905 [Brevundimonas sp.]|nr:hypothetical protein [Brevundimonas sp.]
MNDNAPADYAATWEEIASSVSDPSKWAGDASKTALDDLVTYLEESYGDDDVLKVLVWRAWCASTGVPTRNDTALQERSGALKSERERAERWALYLEGKGSPDAKTPRSLWNGISACFNPHTGKLEEWFVGTEAQTLEELKERYGALPDGEPPAIFN